MCVWSSVTFVKVNPGGPVPCSSSVRPSKRSFLCSSVCSSSPRADGDLSIQHLPQRLLLQLAPAAPHLRPHQLRGGCPVSVSAADLRFGWRWMSSGSGCWCRAFPGSNLKPQLRPCGCFLILNRPAAPRLQLFLAVTSVLLTHPQTQPALAGGAEGSRPQEPLSRPLP